MIRMPLVVTVVLVAGFCGTARAAVLCANPSGSVFVRDACKSSEHPLDPVALGLVGPPGPPGTGGISGHEIVSHQEFLAPTGFAAVRVTCPAGKKVLGGGFDVETPDDIKVFGSEPSDGAGNLIDNGWAVMVKNIGTLTRQVTVTAVCATAQ